MHSNELLKLGAAVALTLLLAMLAKAGLLPAFTAWLVKIVTAALVPG